MIEHARLLAEQGYHILPVAAGRKYPPLSEPQSWQAATAEPAQIEDWWEKYPDANIAWSPGKTDEIVIDLDGPEGIQTLKDLGVRFDPDRPTTATVATPGRGGGWHLIYGLPYDLATDSALHIGKGRLGPGVEFISHKQYALLPPSQVPEGIYRWHDRQVPEPLPSILLPLIQNGDAPPPQFDDQPVDPDCRYCPAAAEGIISDIAAEPEGNRNNLLFWKLRCLLELPDIDHRQWISAAAQAAERGGQTRTEISTTIRSATHAHSLKYGKPGQGPGCKAGYKTDTQTPPPTVPPPPQTSPLLNSTIVQASRITPKIQQYLYKTLIPQSSITILAGDAGKGKSSLTRWLAAQLSNGQLQGDTPLGATIWITGEESEEQTIVPCLKALDANLNNIGLMEYRTTDEHGNNINLIPEFVANDGGNSLQTLIDDMHKLSVPPVRMVVVDSLDYFMAGTDTHNAAEIKQGLKGMRDVCQKNETALVAIQHLNKDTSKNALNRIMGSAAQRGVARTILGFDEHPHNNLHRQLVLLKSNAADIHTTEAEIYEFDSTPIDGIFNPHTGTFTTQNKHHLKWLRSEIPDLTQVFADHKKKGPDPLYTMLETLKTLQHCWKQDLIDTCAEATSQRKAKETYSIAKSTGKLTERAGKAGKLYCYFTEQQPDNPEWEEAYKNPPEQHTIY